MTSNTYTAATNQKSYLVDVSFFPCRNASANSWVKAQPLATAKGSLTKLSLHLSTDIHNIRASKKRQKEYRLDGCLPFLEGSSEKSHNGERKKKS